MKKYFSTRNILSLENGGKEQNLMLMAASKINQKAKTIRKNKKLKMMLRVARIDISKRKNILASISKSNFSLYAMWKKKTIYVEIQ